MPNDNNQQNNDNKDNQDNNNQEQNNTPKSNQIVLGCDSNGNDSAAQDGVAKVLEQSGYTVEKLSIGPSPFANYSYGHDGKQPKGKIGIYLMAASLVSYLDAANASFDYNIFVIRGDASSLITSEEDINTKGIPKDHHGDCPASLCDPYAGWTFAKLNDKFKGKCVAVYGGKTPEEMGQAALAALGGAGSFGGGSVVEGGSAGAQIKDKTFEQCIKRICAATDSVFIVDNNVAVLFPYTDWLAFTLRQQIDTISKEDIDPNVFTSEYNNDGFYNKVSIAWGGETLPERFPSKEDSQRTVSQDKGILNNNITISDISNNIATSNFQSKTLPNPNEVILNKKDKTTQTMSVDNTGTSILSEQYDSLVEKYGVLEKRVESKAPDLETAQYIANALLIQYVRDFNNSCRCRALSYKKYNGGTFHAVQNPFTDDIELFYLNGYSARVQKKEPLYHDLDFRYGPESAEELSDYQSFSGGGAAAGGSAGQVAGDGSATEQQIWADAAKRHYGHECSSDDPKEAYDTLQPNLGKISADCFGMSSYLYYRFNYQAGVPCRIIVGSGSGASGTHRVVELYKNNSWYKPVDEYKALEGLFRYNSSCKSTNNVHKKEPNGGVSNNTNTVGGNTAGD